MCLQSTSTSTSTARQDPNPARPSDAAAYQLAIAAPPPLIVTIHQCYGDKMFSVAIVRGRNVHTLHPPSSPTLAVVIFILPSPAPDTTRHPAPGHSIYLPLAPPCRGPAHDSSAGVGEHKTVSPVCTDYLTSGTDQSG